VPDVSRWPATADDVLVEVLARSDPRRKRPALIVATVAAF
jgi:hypothetical protein